MIMSDLSKVKPLAKEEFSSRSKLVGQSFTPKDLCQFVDSFDPWSRTLFENVVVPENPNIMRYGRNPIDLLFEGIDNKDTLC